MKPKQKRMLARIIVAAVIFAAGYFLPLEGVWRLCYYAALYLLIGWDIVFKAFRGLFTGSFLDENFLMTIASAGAFFVGDYPESAAVMLFYQVGEFFQKMAVAKSRKNISELMDIRPDYANVLRDGEFVTVSPEEAAIGDIILIKPGEKIPLDCVITEGATSVDTASVTGESVPRDAVEGDPLISGCVNISGAVKCRVTASFKDSTASKILALIESASANKAKSEAFITRFSRIYTPAVVGAAVLLAVIPSLITGQWSEWIYRALTFLVISCPCALVISVPLSFFGGIGGASRCGILVKGANYLEALAKVKTVIFDKTGTLTKGSFSVSKVIPSGVEADEVLRLTAAVEAMSNHPIAKSLREACGENSLTAENITELSGRGVSADVNGRRILAGNGLLMQENSIEYTPCQEVGTIVYTAADGKYIGCIVISDEVKSDSKTAISELKRCGAEQTVMLTGDTEAAGQKAAAEIGIDKAYCGLLPADKVAITEKIMAESGGVTVFVGDGVNDAPVLSRADVGIAMGGVGSDAAIEAADIVIMDDKPSKIALAVKCARKTLRIVKQNIVFSLTVKAVILILGAVGLAGMWAAVFADVGVSIIAILNAVRALKVKA
ncbi:MAG: heavy metal translocating P-type ATPase [Ruminiclostridium sp.]